MKRVLVAYAHCCGGSTKLCDCVNSNHGMALLGENEVGDEYNVIVDASPRPSGHCDDDKAWALFSKDYGERTRADLCKGDLSDFALANAQFMCDRNSLDLIVYQTAAKERIRWLSIQLARALSEIGRLRADRSFVVGCNEGYATAIEHAAGICDAKAEEWTGLYDTEGCVDCAKEFAASIRCLSATASEGSADV